ncbi:hypothetical protein E2C01_003907 [Portunus trituberculatus]|uniref:Uncharacterized protein n=1 Tax=Portunus trituberculatus TaxID=210409 RepID=A0A5B7CPX2_PORTR|nr:hypothetical protein [Portunus trituberculatus]
MTQTGRLAPHPANVPMTQTERLAPHPANVPMTQTGRLASHRVGSHRYPMMCHTGCLCPPPHRGCLAVLSEVRVMGAVLWSGCGLHTQHNTA